MVVFLDSRQYGHTGKNFGVFISNFVIEITGLVGKTLRGPSGGICMGSG
jgi:hypothetical protein